MSLQDALRKAAGLLVELPSETSDETIAETPPSKSGASIADASTKEPVDINQLLAEQGLGPQARARDKTREPAKPKTVEQIVREADGPNLDQIKVSSTEVPPPASEGTIDCPAIYAAAKLPPAPFSAEQMLEMLASLPPELPLDTKRQTVKVTLGALGKTMGATPETIVADASRKMAALAAYGEHLSRRTGEFVTNTEAEITALQAQIEDKRKAMQNAQQRLAKTTQMCNTESGRLDDVLEFFSLDVPPSKYAPQGAPGGAPPAVSSKTKNA